MNEQLFRWVKCADHLPEGNSWVFTRSAHTKHGGMMHPVDLKKMEALENVEWLEQVPIPSPGDNQSLEEAAKDYANKEALPIIRSMFTASRGDYAGKLKAAFLAGAQYSTQSLPESQESKEGEEETQEDIDNFAIAFAVWCMGPEGEMYRATRMSAGQLLRTYKDRPYININSSDQ